MIDGLELGRYAYWSDKPDGGTSTSWGGWYFLTAGKYLNIIGEEMSATHRDVAEAMGLDEHPEYLASRFIRVRAYRKSDEIVIYQMPPSGGKAPTAAVEELVWDLYTGKFVTIDAKVHIESPWGTERTTVGEMFGLVEKRRWAFHKVAAWADVYQKALRLVSQGAVSILEETPSMIAGEVQGDHGRYDTVVYLVEGTKQMSGWWCSCAWGQWAWVRRPGRIRPLAGGGYSGLGGRKCSHATALQYISQTRSPSKFEGDE